ncbi:MAG: hypothetical protein RL516_2228 [Bacteroidota bacterium]|jgi:hypothetical protein
MTKFITSTAIVVIAGLALFLTSCGTSPVSERKPIDRLDSIKTDSGIVKELKDVYRVFRINDQLDIIKDDFSLCYMDDSVAAANVLKESFTTSDSLKNFPFYDDSIRILADMHINEFNGINRIIIKHGLQSDILQDSFVKYKEINEQYTDFLFGKYSTNHFIKMSEDQYWKNIDKQQYIHSPEYARYLSMAKTDLKGSIELLKKIIANTKNFQEKSIYQMELANNMICHANKLDSNSITNALKIYKEVLDSPGYSLYKFEAWRRWRAATQGFIYGPMKDSEIPNNLYDGVRENCAAQILKYYINHPKDQMALNQFLDFATHGIVYRSGEYEEGNQNMIEFSELFKLN